MIPASLAVGLAATLLVTASTPAQDVDLAALRETLVALRREGAEAAIKTYGARPALTLAKHQLRDWVEKQLGSLENAQQAEAFSTRINTALKAVSVIGAGDDENLLGSIGQARVTSEAGWLLVTTRVGIICQYDESVYAYKRVGDRWQRVWESEQNDYSPGKYAPQHIAAVHVLETAETGHQGSAFVMTLGNGWGCTSAWHRVYYRVWRVDAEGSRLLIDGSDLAYLRMDTYIVGSMSQAQFPKNAPNSLREVSTSGS